MGRCIGLWLKYEGTIWAAHGPGNTMFLSSLGERSCFTSSDFVILLQPAARKVTHATIERDTIRDETSDEPSSLRMFLYIFK